MTIRVMQIENGWFFHTLFFLYLYLFILFGYYLPVSCLQNFFFEIWNNWIQCNGFFIRKCLTISQTIYSIDTFININFLFYFYLYFRCVQWAINLFGGKSFNLALSASMSQSITNDTNNYNKNDSTVYTLYVHIHRYRMTVDRFFLVGFSFLNKIKYLYNTIYFSC